jgi:hypothetical protein
MLTLSSPEVRIVGRGAKVFDAAPVRGRWRRRSVAYHELFPEVTDE